MLSCWQNGVDPEAQLREAWSLIAQPRTSRASGGRQAAPEARPRLLAACPYRHRPLATRATRAANAEGLPFEHSLERDPEANFGHDGPPFEMVSP